MKPGEGSRVKLFFGKLKLLGRQTFRRLGVSTADLTVSASILVYSVFFSFLSILRHHAYGSAAWDLGIFNQVFWSTTQDGRFFYYTVEQFVIPSGIFFGIHFSPILFLLLPIYSFAPSPETLLIIQSFILGLGALPIYWFARKELEDDVSAVFVAVSYLAYPLLQGVNWFDFHVEAFLPIFVVFLVYYLRNGDWVKHLIFVVLTLCVMEQAAVVVSFIGLYYFFVWRGWFLRFIQNRSVSNVKGIIPLILIAMSMVWYQVQGWVKGKYFPIDPTFLSDYKAVSHWSILGVKTDPIQIPLYVIMDPRKSIQALSYDATLKIIYLLLAFAPLLFVSFRSSHLLMSLSWFAPVFLANYSPYYVIGYQYSAFVIPFIFVATIYGLKKFGSGNKVKARLRRTTRSILIISVILSLLVSPYSPIGQALKRDNIFFFLPPPTPSDSHASLLDEFVNLIPSNASVLTQNNIFPHLSSRVNAYVSPAGLFGPLEKYASYLNKLLQESDYVLVDMSPNYKDASSPLTLESALQRGDFGLYAYAHEIFLLRKNYSGQPIIDERVQRLYDFADLSLNSGSIERDLTSLTGTILVHAPGAAATFWYGPYDALPPGSYLAVYRLKVNSLGFGHILTIDATANASLVTLAQQNIDLSDFANANTWQNFTLTFTVNKPVANVEFRGINSTGYSTITLDYIQLYPM